MASDDDRRDGNDSSVLLLDFTETVSLEIRSKATGGENGSALCRLELLDAENSPQDSKKGASPAPAVSSSVVVRMDVLAAMTTSNDNDSSSKRNNHLLSWTKSFPIKDLLTEWSIEGYSVEKKNEDQKMLVWNKLREYLSLKEINSAVSRSSRASGREEGHSSTAQSEENKASGMVISTEWTLEEEASPLILEVKQGRRGLLMRRLWRSSLSPNANPCQSFHDLILSPAKRSSMLQQIQQHQMAMRNVTKQLEESKTVIQDWKQTAHTLEHGWHREKGPLVQNFLTLYNSQQDHIEELKKQIAKLNHELSQSQTQPDHDAQARTRALQETVPDDHELELDNILAMSNQSTTKGSRKRKQPPPTQKSSAALGESSFNTRGTATTSRRAGTNPVEKNKDEDDTDNSGSQTKKKGKKRRNPITGAIEYLDKSALFADKTLFGSSGSSSSSEFHNSDDDDDDNGSKKKRNRKKRRPQGATRSHMKQSKHGSNISGGSIHSSANDKKVHANRNKNTSGRYDTVDAANDESATDDEEDYIDHDMRHDMLAQLAAMKEGDKTNKNN